MARVRSFGLADAVVRRIALVGVCALGFAGWGAARLGAQDAPTPTLHVYTNLIQIPTLVIDSGAQPVTAIAENRFFVSVDGGPRFKVTHVRTEGDDPITLAIVLDVSQPFPVLIRRIDDAIAGLAPLSLHAKDRVTVYSMDCKLGRSAENLPAEPAALHRAVDAALEQWRAHGRERWKSDCKEPSNLWDSLTVVTRALGEQPGRRVMLVVTDGVDRGSKTPWNETRRFAQARGVAIFGMVEAGGTVGTRNPEDIFRSVCELTGGIVLPASEKSVAGELKNFAGLVRTRYIVEFPHPVDTKGGYHDMNITIDKSDVHVLPTGIGIPVDDAAILHDPTTVPTDPGRRHRSASARSWFPIRVRRGLDVGGVCLYFRDGAGTCVWVGGWAAVAMWGGGALRDVELRYGCGAERAGAVTAGLGAADWAATDGGCNGADTACIHGPGAGADAGAAEGSKAVAGAGG